VNADYLSPEHAQLPSIIARTCAAEVVRLRGGSEEFRLPGVLMDGQNVAMIQGRASPSLVLKSPKTIGIASHAGWSIFTATSRHKTVSCSAMHLVHSACTQGSADLIPAELGAGSFMR
jgi:hypothetical protein